MDYLISFITSIIQKISGTLPTELGFLPLTTYSGFFSAVKTNLIFGLSGIGWLLPVNLLLILIITILIAEATLFGYKAGVFLINLARGSGA